MKKLHATLGDRIHFLDVVVRQAHPGSAAPAYRDLGRKVRDARAYKEAHGIPWTVLVDDLRGTVHQTYGSIPNSTYVMDKLGRVAFHSFWPGVPKLSKVIEDLLARGGEGVIDRGLELLPHPLAAVTAGWPALQRAGKGGVKDMMVAAPGLPLIMWAGYKARRLLSPMTLRAEPLPKWLKVAGAVAVAAAAAWWWRQSRR